MRNNMIRLLVAMAAMSYSAHAQTSEATQSPMSQTDYLGLSDTTVVAAEESAMAQDLLDSITSTIDFSVVKEDIYRATAEELEKGRAIISRMKSQKMKCSSVSLQKFRGGSASSQDGDRTRMY